MTFKELQLIVDQISYKPKYFLDARLALEYDAVEIRLSYPALNVENPSENIILRSKDIILGEALKHLEEEDLLKQVYCLFRTAELHELDEWFKFNGKRLKEPHKEN